MTFLSTVDRNYELMEIVSFVDNTKPLDIYQRKIDTIFNMKLNVFINFLFNFCWKEKNPQISLILILITIYFQLLILVSFLS